MNKHSKIAFISCVMTLGLVSAFSIGLSSWLFVTNVGGSAEIHGADIDDITITGMSITYSGTKLGRYYYEEGDGNKSSTGTIKYTIDVTYKDLPSLLKRDSLYMVGNLSLWNNSDRVTSFFDSDFTYISNNNPWTVVESASSSISTSVDISSSDNIVYEPTENLLTLPSFSFNPNTTSQLILTFSLKQECLLNTDIRKTLIDEKTKFHLYLKVGVNDVSSTEGGE